MHSLHTRRSAFLILTLALTLLAAPLVYCRVAVGAALEETVPAKNSLPQAGHYAPGESRQLFLGAQGKETNTPNFVRLVVMRLIYGIASTMGLEERLDGAFNGVFVPPNADGGDFFGLGGGGGGDDDGGLFGGGGGGGDDDLLGGIFDDGGLL